VAQEKFTVIFGLQESGLTQAKFAEKSIVVEGKNKSKGWEEGTGFLDNVPSKGTVVTLIAESAEEAAKAIRALYGAGVANDKFLVAKTANLSEVVAIP
jgi:hypothetical protein